MVAASIWPGRTALASRSSARLSGPPETATPIRTLGAISSPRSAAKRSRGAGSIGPPGLGSKPDYQQFASKSAMEAIAPHAISRRLGALSGGLGVAFLLLEVRP